MPKFQSQSLVLDLATLQAAGGTTEGDFNLGLALPDDSLFLGVEVVVTTALAGPGLTKATATVGQSSDSPLEGEVEANLMIAGTYGDGGQRYLVSVTLQGCTLDALTAGLITATVYYDQFRL